ncbi:MAG: RluA family pseudouridine synthase [Polyangiales bacterium]
MTRRWVADATTKTLGAVLRAMGLDDGAVARAITDGRVFVGKVRARRSTDPVAEGAAITVHVARADASLPEPFVLHRSPGVIMVDKPAGIATVPDLRGAAGTLLAIVAEQLGRGLDAIDTIQTTSRLDREVSGVVTFATEPVMADAIARARDEGRYARRYLAVAHGHLEGDVERDVARWTWSIGRGRDPMLRQARPATDRTAKQAISRARVVARVKAREHEAMLLALVPETGRTHQLRVHASAAGAPLVGDVAYGGARRWITATGAVRPIDRIALHCAHVAIDLGDDRRIEASAPAPESFRAVARAARSGDDEQLDTWIAQALRCEV